MRDAKVLLLLAAITGAALAFFFFWDAGNMSAYIANRRAAKIAAVLIAGGGIAVSSVLFQTLTHNQILTPGVIGFDALYLFIQGAVLFFAGTATPAGMDARLYYLVNVAVMIVFAELLYRVIFRGGSHQLYFVLLAGVVCGMLFRSAFSFFMMLIDPEQFDILQTKIFVSFNTIPQELILPSLVLTLLALVYGARLLPQWDVFLLGTENAHNLGVDTHDLQRRTMRIIAVLVAASTALVGPLTFLGLLVVNIAYGILHSYRHSVVLLGTTLVTWAALFLGLVIVERVFSFTTNLTVILNFVGGTYFIYLLLREGKGKNA